MSVAADSVHFSGPRAGATNVGPATSFLASRAPASEVRRRWTIREEVKSPSWPENPFALEDLFKEWRRKCCTPPTQPKSKRQPAGTVRALNFNLGLPPPGATPSAPGSAVDRKRVQYGALNSSHLGSTLPLVPASSAAHKSILQDVVKASNNKTIVMIGPSDATAGAGPFGPSWERFQSLLDGYPDDFVLWLQRCFIPATMASCRPRHMKKFRRLSKWCRSMVRTGQCSFGVKCNFCHHFSEFSPMRCENDGACSDQQCWYMHSAEVEQQIGNFMQVQIRQIAAIVIGAVSPTPRPATTPRPVQVAWRARDSSSIVEAKQRGDGAAGRVPSSHRTNTTSGVLGFGGGLRGESRNRLGVLLSHQAQYIPAGLTAGIPSNLPNLHVGLGLSRSDLRGPPPRVVGET